MRLDRGARAGVIPKAPELFLKHSIVLEHMPLGRARKPPRNPLGNSLVGSPKCNGPLCPPLCALCALVPPTGDLNGAPDRGPFQKFWDMFQSPLVSKAFGHDMNIMLGHMSLMGARKPPQKPLGNSPVGSPGVPRQREPWFHSRNAVPREPRRATRVKHSSGGHFESFGTCSKVP